MYRFLFISGVIVLFGLAGIVGALILWHEEGGYDWDDDELGATGQRLDRRPGDSAT